MTGKEGCDWKFISQSTCSQAPANLTVEYHRSESLKRASLEVTGLSMVTDGKGAVTDITSV